MSADFWAQDIWAPTVERRILRARHLCWSVWTCWVLGRHFHSLSGTFSGPSYNWDFLDLHPIKVYCWVLNITGFVYCWDLSFFFFSSQLPVVHCSEHKSVHVSSMLRHQMTILKNVAYPDQPISALEWGRTGAPVYTSVH